jgi:hypothetical protein
MRMRRIGLCVLSVISLLLGVGATFAQQSQVTRGTNVRQDADGKSKIVKHLNATDKITLTSTVKTSGYYPVRTSDGIEGWVWAANVSLANNMRAAQFSSEATAAQGAKLFTAECANPQYPGKPTVMDRSSCPAAGNGGPHGIEINQNKAKNNFCASGKPEQTTIADMIALQKAVEKANPPIPWGSPAKTTQDRSGLEGFGELQPAVLTGYLAYEAQEGAESVNCKGTVPDQDAYHDIHMSIVPTKGGNQCDGIVAEMIPHYRPDSWNPTNLKEIQNAQLLVRVTGSRMFDSAHVPCNGENGVGSNPKRRSLWEIHPIYKFEVCTEGACSNGSGWVDLEVWKPEG